MRKLIITEEERKSILGLHGIVEQTTPTTTPTPTQPTAPLTPAEQKRQEYLKKREAQKASNAARLAPIEAAQKKRIDNWIAANPGPEGESYEDGAKRYWKDQEKRQSGPDATLDGLETGKANKRTKKTGSCTTGETMGGDSLRDVN